MSAEDVLSGRAAPELFRDKLVLVGVTGLGLLDFPATPLGERIPGVDVHAQVLEQVFHEAALKAGAAADVQLLTESVAGRHPVPPARRIGYAHG